VRRSGRSDAARRPRARSDKSRTRRAEPSHVRERDDANTHEAPPAPPLLTSRQRKSLRGQAHRLEPVVLVGQAGLTDAVVHAVDVALTTHELVKVRLREPEDKHAAADELAERSHAALCGLVGHTVILFRPHPERPRIVP
jgi:RNA-binding protein